MKLLLLHGPAINVSRIKMQAMRSKFPPDNVMVFEKGEDISIILTNLQSQSLFDRERLVILENPLEDLTFDSSDSLTLILWFDHEIAEKKPVFEWVKKSKGEILFFPASKETSIFPLLDYLAAGDKKAFLEIEKSKFDIHYIITMVFYLLRNLTATPKNAPLFVRQKLERQRKNFSLDKLKKLYQDILEIDFKLKSGLLEKDQAQFLLVNLFYQ